VLITRAVPFCSAAPALFDEINIPPGACTVLFPPMLRLVPVSESGCGSFCRLSSVIEAPYTTRVIAAVALADTVARGLPARAANNCGTVRVTRTVTQ
jgi:hypothetical protein